MLSDQHEAPDADDWRRHHQERQERVAAETPALIAEIAARVASLPADQLLCRAHFEYLVSSQGVQDDTGIGTEQVIATRMIDYIQSVIAAVPPAADQKAGLSDEDWTALRHSVGKLFTTNIEAVAAVQVSEGVGFQDPEQHPREALLQSSLVRYWHAVSGKRFPYHFRQHLSDLLLPHTEMIEDALGVTASDLIDALVGIENALRFGTAVTQRDLEQSGILQELAGDTPSLDYPSASGTAPEWVNRAADELDWPTSRDDILERAMGPGIFDVERSADLPEALLRSLSWGPGENQSFFAPGELAGSPLRTWPIFERPFLRLDGRYYCFAPLRFIDHVYAAVERLVLQLRPDEKNRWLETRAHQMERVVAEHFSRLLPDARVLTNVHYGAHNLTGEVDVLVMYDDHLLIVEVKSGDYTDLPPATDFAEHLRSVQKLGVVPGRQLQKFSDYLQAAESVPVYDSNNKRTRKKLADLSLSDFRQVSLCAVTLEPFTEFATQLHHLKEFGIDPGERPTWVISLDDLHVYADVFDNPVIFLHYIEHRLRASRAERLTLDDELDHLGMYLAHNNYPAYVGDKLDEDEVSMALWFGYRASIERRFHQRLLDPQTTLALRQDLPERLSEIIDHLASSGAHGRARVASYLLDRAGAERIRIVEGIAEEVARHPSAGKPTPMATNGPGDQMVVFCWSPYTGGRTPAMALLHAKALVVMHKEERRLLLELRYSRDGELQAMDWQWVAYAEIPESELPELETRALAVRRRRKTRALSARRDARLSNSSMEPRRIGRNELCVCGSGKKYKRCCIDLRT